MKNVEFTVNPIAGMGRAVSLKGTNGRAVLESVLRDFSIIVYIAFLFAFVCYMLGLWI